MSELLTRDEILAARELPKERVSVPEWGGHVLVWTLPSCEKDRLEEALQSPNGDGEEVTISYDNLRARFVAASVKDAAGVKLFTDEDVVALGQQSCLAMDRVFTVASRLNGLTKEDLEELRKNSSGDRPDSSGSG